MKITRLWIALTVLLSLVSYSCQNNPNTTEKMDELDSIVLMEPTPDPEDKRDKTSETTDTETDSVIMDYLILPEGVAEWKIGGSFDIHSTSIIAETQHSGEGSFEVFKIQHESLGTIGFITPERENDSIIRYIEVVHPAFKTEKGIGIGTSFRELKEQYPSSETHGSEIEGITSTAINGLSFTLNTRFWSHQIDESEIDPSTVITSIYVMGKQPEVAVPENEAIDHYICYTNDTDELVKIWIGFGEDGKALEIRYLGQEKSKRLSFIKEEFLTGGAYPTITQFYKEIDHEELNGQYVLTHSGNWDYVKYTLEEQGVEFNYTIDHNANPYGKTPCF